MIKQIVEQIIKSIENSSVVAVRALKQTITSHTYLVKVLNPVKDVTVRGSVRVENQIDNKEITRILNELKGILPTLKRVTVENQVVIPQFPKFPTEISVSNLKNTTEVTNFKEILTAISNLEKSIGKLKLNPEIKIGSPVIPAPIVNIPATPAPVVNLNEKEVDFKPLIKSVDKIKELWGEFNVKNPLAVRLSDGKAFYKAVDRLAEAVSFRAASSFKRVSGEEERAIVDSHNRVLVANAEYWGLLKKETITDTTYILEQTIDDDWRINKIVKTSSLLESSYATIKNNQNVTNYSDAWDNRSSITYGDIEEALG